MRKLRAAAVFLALLALLPACSETREDAGNVIEVYRVVKEEFQSGGELIGTETIELSPGADKLHSALAAISQPSGSAALEKAAPEGVEIQSYILTDGMLTVNVTPEYLELTGMQKTLSDYCLALTLCALDEVESVSVYVGGKGVSLGLRPEDVLLYDSEMNPSEKQLRLYFADGEGRYLQAEYRSLAVSDDTMIERCVVEEILRGPNSERLSAAVPEGTLLLGLSTTEGVCTVNLSEAFLSKIPETAAGQRLAVYSLVNSLTTISGVDSVRLAVGGVILAKYGWMTIDGELTRNDGAIGPENTAKGEEDVDIYMSTPDGVLTPIPRIIVPDEYYSLEYTLTGLLMGELEEPGFKDPFPAGSGPNTVETRSGICYVDIPAKVIDGMTQEEADLAIRALAATLLGVDGVDYVTVATDGDVYAERLTYK